MRILGNGLLTHTLNIILSTPSTPVLLDGISNVVNAYSIRKLLTNYRGNAIQVSLSSGLNQIIGFSGNNLNTSALETFVGNNTVAVTTLYDQVGNTNLSQSTFSQAPIIINSGTLQTAGDQPTLSFNNQNLISTVNIPQFPLTIIAVIEISGSTNGAFVKCGDGEGSSGVGVGVGNGYNVDSPGVGIVGLNEGIAWIPEIGTSIPTTEMAIVEVNATGSSTNIYLNGVLISSGGNANAPINYYYLGGYLAGGIYQRFPTCRISENIVFNTIISSDLRATIVANMKDYYGIS